MLFANLLTNLLTKFCVVRGTPGYLTVSIVRTWRRTGIRTPGSPKRYTITYQDAQNPHKYKLPRYPPCGSEGHCAGPSTLKPVGNPVCARGWTHNADYLCQKHSGCSDPGWGWSRLFRVWRRAAKRKDRIYRTWHLLFPRQSKQRGCGRGNGSDCSQ